MSPAAIAAGGGDTATIRVTVVNLTARPVERVLHCDNLFEVENLVGEVVVSRFRVTCPAENSVPETLRLEPFASVERTRRWAGVTLRYGEGTWIAVVVPPGRYRVYGTLGELRSTPKPLDLVGS